MKNFLHLAQAAVTEKDWLKAAGYYREVLNVNPDDEQVLCNLSLCYVKARQFEKAQDLLEAATKKFPKKAIFQRQLGNIYKRQGLLMLAKQCYKQAIELEPLESSNYNNLGLVYYKESRFDKAVDSFNQALTLKKDYGSAMYNLALAYEAQNKTKDAIASLITLTETFPDYFQSYFLLGKILLKKGLKEEASKYFIKLVSLQPDNPDVLRNVAYCLLESNQYALAKPYCQTLVSLNQQDFEMKYNLGVIAEKEGDVAKAMSHYHDALLIDGQYYDAINNLAVLYLNQQDIINARIYFERALEIKPDDESIQYTLAAISGEKALTHAPKNHIAKLFDQYAGHFDEHLLEGLNYQVPTLLFDAVDKTMGSQFVSQNVLDLGCGTGLAGHAFKPKAKKLVGVDLSPNMIEQASAKSIYDELLVDDMLVFLGKTDDVFDLVIAADVLVYVGDLTDVFLGVRKRLSPGGAFAFSVELTEGEQYALDKTGRFSHSLNYIQQLAKQYHFKIRYAESKPTRVQRDESVMGGIFVLTAV